MVLLKFAFLVRLGLSLRRFFLWLADAVVPSQLAMFDRSIGLSETLMIAAVSELGIADKIERGKLSVKNLAESLSVNEDVLLRVLRALSDRGIFDLKNGFLVHTRLSRTLCTNHPNALRYWALYYGSESHGRAWLDLRNTLRDGRSAFDRLFGETVWDYFAKHPVEENNFARAMMGVTRTQMHVITSLYDFSKHQTICDVGGGRGLLLTHILEKHSQVKGIVYDAKGVIESLQTSERLTALSGNFFEHIPAGADCYLLKNILHDWDDEICLQILGKVHAAMKSGDTLLIFEQLIDVYEPNPLASFSDVQMIISCSNGRERNVAHFEKLLNSKGFTLHRPRLHPVICVLSATKN